jgi:hypothetical protein
MFGAVREWGIWVFSFEFQLSTFRRVGADNGSGDLTPDETVTKATTIA